MMRFTVVTVHGEGASLFHVVDTDMPATWQPAIVASYRNDRPAAEQDAARRNEQDAKRLQRWEDALR